MFWRRLRRAQPLFKLSFLHCQGRRLGAGRRESKSIREMEKRKGGTESKKLGKEEKERRQEKEVKV